MTEPRDLLDPMDGEVGRALIRIEASVESLRVEMRESRHRLANDISVLVAPVAALGIRMNVAEKNIEDVSKKVDAVTLKAAWISGAIGSAISILQFIPWPWKH
jgi:hypothetical protein